MSGSIVWEPRCFKLQKRPSRGAVIGEHPYRSEISIKLLCNFIEVILRHGCSPVNLLYIFKTPFLKNTPGRLLLKLRSSRMLDSNMRENGLNYLTLDRAVDFMK